MSWFKKAFSSIKAATKSPIFKIAAGGLAIAFPVVGIPAAAALAIGDKALTLANSANAVTRGKYRAAIIQTEKLAAAGDPDAKRAFNAMRLAKDARAGKPAAVREAQAIKAHHARTQQAKQAVLRQLQMHPRTGMVSVRAQFRRSARA
jgi:hypothetical protein